MIQLSGHTFISTQDFFKRVSAVRLILRLTVPGIVR